MLNTIPVPEFVDSEKVKKAEDYPKEMELLELLKQDSIKIDSLELLRKAGADLNIVLEVTEKYTYTKSGAKIPIIKNFIHNKTKTGTRKVLQNPLQVVLSRPGIVNKMDAVLWLLKNGADPNVKGEEQMNAVEVLMKYAVIYNETMGIYYDPNSFFNKSKSTKEAAENYPDNIGDFTMHYIDTLEAYGANLKEVNMRYASDNIFLVERLLKGGADPINLDIERFFQWGLNFQPEAKVNELLAYPLPYDSLKSPRLLFKLELEQIEICLENGLDPNQSFDGQYLLPFAITLRNYKTVRLLVEHGAHIIDDEGTRPLDYAKEKEITDERILEILADIPL